MDIAKKKPIETIEYTVTRIAYSVGTINQSLIELASVLGKLRSELWNKYGSLQSWGINKNEIIKNIRNDVKLRKIYGAERFNLSSEIWERTVQALLDDIHATQEAAKVQIIRKIYEHFKPERTLIQKGKKLVCVDIPETSFRQELIIAINSAYSVWHQYPIICRWVRQFYKRGHTWVNNQIVINATASSMKGKITKNSRSVTTYKIPTFMDGQKCQWVEIKIHTGRTCPKAGRLRLIFNGEKFELHYPHTTQVNAIIKTDIIGLDKGFTEGFYGSNGQAYVERLGEVIKVASNNRTEKNKKRSVIFAISQKVDANKSSQIFKNNLGRKKASKKDSVKRLYIRQLIRTDVNQIFSSFGEVVAEDLSKHIKGKKRAKAINRKLNEWSKGELQKALDEISVRKVAKVTLVNPAYTSQVDSNNGTLLGKRIGDKFISYQGIILQSDMNAAINIKNRALDSEITRFMKKEVVHKILLNRTAQFLSELGYTLETAVYMGWLDSKHLMKVKTNCA